MKKQKQRYDACDANAAGDDDDDDGDDEEDDDDGAGNCDGALFNHPSEWSCDLREVDLAKLKCRYA